MISLINRLKDSITPYIKITRIDHNIKNIFIIPGILFAIIILETNLSDLNFYIILFGIVVACIGTSSNYVINEYLDKEKDAKHPYKNKRSLITNNINPKIVIFEYVFLIFISIYLSTYIGFLYSASIIILIISGIIYNIKPFRSKDIVFLDTLTESLNSPIRFFIGWFLVDQNSLPPLSLIIAYYFLGAFLMNSKRLSEFKYFENINQLKELINYRNVFSKYNTKNLITLSYIYSYLTLIFFSIFLFKYKIELILFLPFIIFLLIYYNNLSLDGKLVTSNPEILFRQRKVLFFTILSSLFFLILLYLELNFLTFLLDADPMYLIEIIND